MERQQSAVDVGHPESDAGTLKQIGGCFWRERLCDPEPSTPRGVLRIYNDLDSNLYNMMYCVREKPVSVITELKYMQNSREEFETMLRTLKDKEFAGKN